ncbi:MAG: cystathionine gamma-synthase family protein [Elusimicrobia bacterium]|nr:cystathionine gamma-synthase family protein [Elusimicrobiota bacterium]
MSKIEKGSEAEKFKPESLMMSYGYHPEWSEGALKCPIFQTSTFVFKNAEAGKRFFAIAHGQQAPGPAAKSGLIYSRMNNPDLEILEDRLTLWDNAEACAVFASGMGAIATALLEFLRPGDTLLFSEPIYGGTESFLRHVLTRLGIAMIGFKAGSNSQQMEHALKSSGRAERLAMIFFETPANPTNTLVDIETCVDLARRYSTKDRRVLTAVDNTFLGPLFQHPIKHGADLVIYSATKFIGGHSDVIAGACLGSAGLIKRVKKLRSYLGTMCDPWTGWLLMRSLETLKIRMACQAENAAAVAGFLSKHPKVEKVYYLGHLKKSDPQHKIYKKQCLSAGSMVSFDIRGGEKAAFRFLNSLRLITLAVSLGGTESLAEHPGAMTHSDMDPQDRKEIGISDKMIRLSVGIENAQDLIADIKQALERV